VTIASSFFSPDNFQYYAPLQQGIPIIRGPDVSSGRVPLDRAAAEYTPEIDNIDRGYVQTWNIAYERRLPMDLTVDVAYVGAKGTGGYAGLDINAPTVIGSGDRGRPYFSLGRSVAINSWGDRLRTRYNSLQVAVNKSYTHGFLLKAAYTLSKAMNESDNDGRATLAFNTPSQLDRNWAPAGFDRRHNLQVGFLYQLPWQTTNGYPDVAHAILGDWQLNGVFGAFTGNPFTMTGSGTLVNTPSNQQTADLVGSYVVLDKIGSAGTWFDTSQFKQPDGVRFGNTGRNQFYGPGGLNLDLGIQRSFPVGGQRRIEARITAGNILNTPVFANPQNNVTSGTFGQITGIAGGTALTNAAYTERSVVLGLRFTF
jgi:hypothetical protein